MKSFPGLLLALAILAMARASHSLLAGGTDEGVPHLTADLRDGSRVVGRSAVEKMKFHSALLGNLKLAVGSWTTLAFIIAPCLRLKLNP